MKEYDFSIKNQYYSQVNNKFVPTEACMPTSFIMALAYNKITVIEAGSKLAISDPYFQYPKGQQPEDYLMALCRSLWGIELRDKIAWAKKANIAPNQVHAVISEIVNCIVGSKVTEFLTNRTIDDLMLELKQKRAVVVSGQFTKEGHAVTVCGYREDDGGKVHDILIDDPFGNYFTGYKDKQGNNTWFAIDTFKTLWAGWYHRFDVNGV